MLKKADLRIYQPINPLEKRVQENFHNETQDWLNEKECKLVAKSLLHLKSFDDWLENDNLLSTRIGYFFAPEMTISKSTMVFLTHPLYVRDIIENREIQSTLFSPISFVTTPLAKILFKDYPVHIYVDLELIKKENKHNIFTDIGGLVITEDNVKLPDGCIEKIKIVGKDRETTSRIYGTVLSIQREKASAEKFAEKIAPGVFRIDEAERELYPDSKIWDKRERKPAVIKRVDKGEMGDVIVEYEEGVRRKIPKGDFDQKFIVTAQSVNIEVEIKNRLLKSKAVMKLFKDFEVSPERLSDLRIEIVDLQDRYAETDDQSMKLDKSLFESGDFFRNYFFVVAHEIVHWLSRIKEKDAYFNDPEEVLGFVSAVAYEIEQKTGLEGIWGKIYPKVEWHFSDKANAKKFFEQMFEKAQKLLR